MQLKRVSLFILILLALGWLAACTGDILTEATPIPPPPTSDSEGDGMAADESAATSFPTDLPDETAVEPTPTLIPTATPTSEAVATAVTDPPVQVIAGQPLPAAGRDLLFIADGAFKQWNHATGQIETIVAGPDAASLASENPDRPAIGSVTDYVMSEDGKRAVVARVLSTAVATGIENAQPEFSYELLFVDMISREIWTLVPQADNLAQFDLSPNAQQLAFVASGLDGIPDATSSEPAATNLYVMETGGGNPGSVRQVYACQPQCISPQWHIESNLVAFGDGAALWLYNIAANEPEQLLENQGFERDMADLSDISVYWPVEWANNGRYLLLWRGRWEGGSWAVLDVPTGGLAPVPASFIYVSPFANEVSWMPDDRLLIWRTAINDIETTPQVGLWRFDLAAGSLILEESATLSDRRLGVLGGSYLEDGRFAFALNIYPGPEGESTASQASGTYLLTSLAETPERVNSLPPAGPGYAQVQAIWSRDGSGALLVQADRPDQPKLFYAPAGGAFLYDITAVFGQNPHAFRWQPEIIVP